MREDFIIKGFQEEILSIEKRAELLEKSVITKGFKFNEIKTLAGFFEFYQVGVGTVICEQGEKGDFMCLVYKGRVDVVKKDINHNDKIIAALGPGNTIGEMSLIDGEPRSALVVVHTPANLLVLTSDNFALIEEAHPRLWGKVVMRISKVISKRLRQTSGILAEYLSEWPP